MFYFMVLFYYWDCGGLSFFNGKAIGRQDAVMDESGDLGDIRADGSIGKGEEIRKGENKGRGQVKGQ